MQLEFDLRVPIERTHQQIADAKHHGVEHRSQLQATGRLSAQTLGGMLQMLNRADDLLGLRQEPAAGRGQVHPRRGPFEQADAELLLQGLDVARDRRLAQMQRLSRARQMGKAGDGDKGA